MIVQATREQIKHVLEHTQQIERDGLDAVLWGGLDADAFSEALSQQPLRYCALAKDGEPVVVGGFVFKTPAVGEAWMWGTDRWGEVVIEVTTRTRQAVDDLLAHELRRIEVYSIATHTVAHRWYRRCLKMQGPLELPEYGTNGEMFYLFSKTRGDL